MASKKEKELAYEAGQHLRRTSNADLPEDAVNDPVVACPFEPGSEERAQWLQGYADAHGQENMSIASINKALADEVPTDDASKRVKP